MGWKEYVERADAADIKSRLGTSPEMAAFSNVMEAALSIGKEKRGYEAKESLAATEESNFRSRPSQIARTDYYKAGTSLSEAKTLKTLKEALLGSKSGETPNQKSLRKARLIKQYSNPEEAIRKDAAKELKAEFGLDVNDLPAEDRNKFLDAFINIMPKLKQGDFSGAGRDVMDLLRGDDDEDLEQRAIDEIMSAPDGGKDFVNQENIDYLVNKYKNAP